MNKGVKHLLGAALIFGAGIGVANAWVISVTGTVGSGYDQNGTFFSGSPSNLQGQAFTLSTTVDNAAYAQQSSSYTSASAYGSSNPFSVSLTLNGVTKNYDVDAAYSGFGSSYLQSDKTTFGWAWDQAYQIVTNTSGSFEVSSQVASNLNSFGIGVDFNQVWSYVLQAGDSFSTVFMDGEGVFFAIDSYGYHGGSISSISLNQAGGSDVPEPASIALVCLGIGGLVARRCTSK